MYKINELLIYRKDVCKVLEIKEKAYNNTDYYVLSSLRDKSLTSQVPVDNKMIRSLITKKDIEDIIAKIPDIPLIDDADNKGKMNEQKYKELLKEGTHEGLIRIIKTTYLRNKNRLDNNKKISDGDNNYFNLAEQYLYLEIAAVLGKTFDEAKEYVLSSVEELTNMGND